MMLCSVVTVSLANRALIEYYRMQNMLQITFTPVVTHQAHVFRDGNVVFREFTNIPQELSLSESSADY